MTSTIKLVTTVGVSLLTNFDSPEVQKAYAARHIGDLGIGAHLRGMLRGESVSPLIEERIRENIGSYFLNQTYLEEQKRPASKPKWKYDPDRKSVNRHASAEIQSTLEILKRKAFQEKNVQIYLLCTDTPVSGLAASLIKEALEKIQLLWEGKLSVKIRLIEGLQIFDKKEFEDKGFDGLFAEIQKVKKLFPRNAPLHLNVTAGYKGVLPVLSIIGQLFRYPLYYVYEHANSSNTADALIEIPPMPVQFDWTKADLWQPYLMEEKPKGLSELEKQLFEEQLVPYRLFSPDGQGNFQRTSLGKIFNSYLNENTPHGNTVLGLYMEYKFLDFFLEEFDQSYNVRHSIDQDEVEIDLLLDNIESGNQIWVEVKAFNQVRHAYDLNGEKDLQKRNYKKKKINRYGEKLAKQLGKLSADNIRNKESFYLMVFYQRFQDPEEEKFKLNLQKLKETISDAGIGEFRVFVVKINLSMDLAASASNNPYKQEIMNKKITMDAEKLKPDPRRPYNRYLLLKEYDYYKTC